MAAHNSFLRVKYQKENRCICGLFGCEYYGLCHCGCGTHTTRAKGNAYKMDGTIGTISGLPQKYKLGHQPKSDKARSHKGKPQGKTIHIAKDLVSKGEFHGLCYCGCEGKTGIAKVTAMDTEGNYKQIVGLPKRYIKGHSKKGQDNPNFVKVHKDNKGYIKLYKPGHPASDARGRVFEHRLVMEEKIGRYLERGLLSKAEDEVVHHINENPSDNRLENLQLMTHGEHTRFHRSKK